MPDFDPDKFLAETKPTEGFDPDKFLQETAPKPVENKHDLVPFLKNVGSGLMHMGGQAIGGVVNAAMNPVQTATDIAKSIDINNSLGSHDGEGIYRTIRSIPVAGPAIDSIVSSGKALGAAFSGGPEAGIKAEQDYHADMAQHDNKHAKEHPLTDFIQRSAGSMVLAPEQAGVIAADTFGKSLSEGNSTWDAMKDARNALALSAAAVGMGHVISSGAKKTMGSIPGKLGISDEAMAQNAGGIVDDVIPESAPLNGDFPKPEPTPAPQVVDPQLANQFKAGNNQGDYFAKMGQKVGGTVGGGSGYLLGHGIGGTVGVPVGMYAGKALGGLVDTYGAPAVKMVQDAGIMLDKIADTPYIGALMKSAAEGSQSLAVTHYMLSQTDPKYQELTKKAETHP